MLIAECNTMIEIEAKGLNRYTFVGYFDPIYHRDEDAPTTIKIIGVNEEHAKERLCGFVGRSIARRFMLEEVSKLE